ncbi:MAG: penicillin-binding protein 1A [Desulfosalsimonas sp.]
MMKKSFWIKSSLLILAALACGAVAAAVFTAMRDLPEIQRLENFSPSSVSRIYSADGVLLSEVFVQKRIPVTLKQIPDRLEGALLATEDRKFYEHSGLDLKGILRAMVHDIMAMSFQQGASTITQQLAKTLFLTPEKSLERKLKEAILALQMERRYTKDEILELYLNQVYFGNGAYGVEAAAQTYFNKSVSELNLAECAMIAGLPKAPSAYSPLIDPELAVERRNPVLRQMRQTGAITPEAHAKARDKSYTRPGKNGRGKTRAPYFVDFVKRRVEAAIGSDLLYKGGVTVFTSLSWKLQQAAEQAMDKGLSELAGRIKKNGTTGSPPQGALVALDAQTGGIRAMVGGQNYHESPFNRATMARRQPGSAFKPILYACALEHGFGQDTMLQDSPVSFSEAGPDGDWMPQNFSRDYAGEITLRKALTHSKNIPAVRMLRKLGPAAVIDFARDMGITSPLSPDLSMALGTHELTLLELTAAYAVFPNQGRFADPHGAIRVVGSDGRVIREAKPQRRMVMYRTGAAVMTDMLKGVINEGTGRRARDIGRAVAGKTGTTNKYKDALFVGYSPAIAAGVWVGRDDYARLGPGETGARAALPIWKDFMKKALEDQPLQYFDFPDELEQVRMDPDTAKRVSGDKGITVRIRKAP